MISLNNNIIAQLPGNQVLVQKNKSSEQTDSLSDSQKEAVDQLKKRDREVKEHEAVHSRNPELHTIGAPRYTYTIGPDGKIYAVGGEVTLSTGPAKDADDAIRKAEALKKASLAPGEPSPQDFAAAASAEQMKADALKEKDGEANPYKKFLDKEREPLNSFSALK